MSDKPISVEVKQQGILVKNPRAAMKIYQEEMVAGVEKVLQWLWMKVIQKTPSTAGILRGSIKPSKVIAQKLNIRGTVGSPLQYALPVEHGRRPGKMPNIDNIKEWMKTKMGLVDDKAAYLIARKIMVQGIPGVEMFGKTHAEEKARVLGILNAAGAKTAQRWRTE